MSDFYTLLGGSKPVALWVSGTTYRIGDYFVSPLSSHVYMRKTNGAGTTDPANDQTNWRLIGAGGIKSIQRGIIAFGNTSAATAIVTISAINTTNAQLRLLGWLATNEERLASSCPYIELTSSTVITAKRTGNSSGVNQITTLSWEVTEYWS